MGDGYSIAVIGGGTMGCGLAIYFEMQGQQTALIEHREENIVKAKETIRETVGLLNEEAVVAESPSTVVDSIDFALDLDAHVTDADVVLETVSEDLSIKHGLFREVRDAAPEDAILATNTSGLSIDAIAEGVPADADRVIGCHWCNPPYLMPIVEIIPGKETAEQTTKRTEQFVEALDGTPIVLKKDVPGFIWNRIQFAVLRECMYLVENDVASIDAVNRMVRDGYARRTAAIGPFETVDLSGLGLYKTIATELYPELRSDDEPSDLFDEFIDKGRTGIDSDGGFFTYESIASAHQKRNKRIMAVRKILDKLPQMHQGHE